MKPTIHSLDPFSNVMASYREAVLAKDVDAFVALYEHDACIFDAWEERVLHGLEAWRLLVREWFSSLNNDQVILNIDSIGCTYLESLAIGHCVVTYTAVSQDGVRLRSISNRLTMGLRCALGDWKIFHEHTSTPVDHRTLKAFILNICSS